MLEIRGQYLIVMTSSGEFCKIPPTEGLITEGEEIEFTHTLEANDSTPARGKRYAWKSWTYAAAACLLLLITALPLWNMVFASAYATVSIDINPSFELEVNERYEVTGVHALNKDAERIVPDIDWKKHTLIEVTKDIIFEARKQGYLEKNHDVLIVPVGMKNPAASQELLEIMKKEVPVFTSSGMGELTVTMMESTKEMREQARKLGISAGKYALYDSMKSIDKSLGEDSIRRMSISEVSSAIGGFKNIPNAVQYSNVPSTLKKEQKKQPEKQPAQVPSIPKQLADNAEASPHKNPEPQKKKTASVRAEQDNLPVKRTPKLTEQEQKDKSTGVPKLIAADTKHKAEVQAQKEEKRSEEDKKYNSGYGQQQQQSQQGGRTIKKEEKERNEKYKEEREQNKQNADRSPHKETEKKTQHTDEKKEDQSDKKSTSSADKHEESNK